MPTGLVVRHGDEESMVKLCRAAQIVQSEIRIEDSQSRMACPPHQKSLGGPAISFLDTDLEPIEPLDNRLLLLHITIEIVEDCTVPLLTSFPAGNGIEEVTQGLLSRGAHEEGLRFARKRRSSNQRTASVPPYGLIFAVLVRRPSLTSLFPGRKPRLEAAKSFTWRNPWASVIRPLRPESARSVRMVCSTSSPDA